MKRPRIKYNAKTVTTDSIVDWYVEHHYGNESESWKRTMKDRMKLTHQLNDTRYQKLNDVAARKRALADAKRAAEQVLDPEGFILKEAKQNAFINTPNAFDKLTQLNRRIDKHGFLNDTKYLGQDSEGMNVMLNGYYEIKNSNYVLAYVSVQNPYSTSPNQAWLFIDRGLI